MLVYTSTNYEFYSHTFSKTIQWILKKKCRLSKKKRGLKFRVTDFDRTLMRIVIRNCDNSHFLRHLLWTKERKIYNNKILYIH